MNSTWPSGFSKALANMAIGRRYPKVAIRVLWVLLGSTKVTFLLYKNTLFTVEGWKVLRAFVHGCCVDDVRCVLEPLPHDIYAFGSADTFIERILDGSFLVPAGWSERVLREVTEHNVSSVGLRGRTGVFLNTLLRRYTKRM